MIGQKYIGNIQSENRDKREQKSLGDESIYE